jgi:hypothetical protein
MARAVGRAALAAGLLLSGVAGADPESCREWRAEHVRWKTEALRRYLRAAPQPELDAAVFEVLQRETWLTSCEVSVRSARDDLVGWRLVGRLPEDYGAAVAESVLERAGFDLGLRGVFAEEPARLSVVSSRPGPARGGFRRGVASR